MGVSGSVIELKVPFSIIGNPTSYYHISAKVENCCATDPILVLDERATRTKADLVMPQ